MKIRKHTCNILCAIKRDKTAPESKQGNSVTTILTRPVSHCR